MRRAERGFTLLEVLAAVAILGILYTTLVGVAMQGLQAEGTSRRRLEASLIADRQLAELDLQLDTGVVPPIGEEDTEQGDFRITLSVEPFDLVLPGLEDERGQNAPLLSDVTADKTTPLRVIRIVVSWPEGDVEQQVVRTTFGFDASTVDLNALAPQTPGQEGDESQPSPQGTEG